VTVRLLRSIAEGIPTWESNDIMQMAITAIARCALAVGVVESEEGSMIALMLLQMCLGVHDRTWVSWEPICGDSIKAVLGHLRKQVDRSKMIGKIRGAFRRSEGPYEPLQKMKDLRRLSTASICS
jgi:hypothetical protein